MEECTLIQNNQYYFFNLIGTTEMMESYRGQYYSYIRNKKGISVPIWPSFYLFDINTDDPKSVITKAADKKIPWQIWIENLSYNLELIKTVEDNGFVRIADYTGMVVDISPITDYTVQGIEVKRVDRDKELRDWAHVIAKDWWQGDHHKEEVLYRIYNEFYLKYDAELFVAYSDGIPVGTSLGILDGDSVGLYLIYTKPEFRNRGIGKLLTQCTLAWGKEKGYNCGVLHATDEGEVIYNQMGFKPILKSSIFLMR